MGTLAANLARLERLAEALMPDQCRCTQCAGQSLAAFDDDPENVGPHTLYTREGRCWRCGHPPPEIEIIDLTEVPGLAELFGAVLWPADPKQRWLLRILFYLAILNRDDRESERILKRLGASYSSYADGTEECWISPRYCTKEELERALALAPQRSTGTSHQTP